jgi:hypothetical protein
MNEFNEIVKAFSELCDMKSFSTQFNVFYWLFQQNPNLSEYFLMRSQELEQEIQLAEAAALAKKNTKNESLKNRSVGSSNNSLNQTKVSGMTQSQVAEKDLTVQEKPASFVTTPAKQQVMAKSATFNASVNEYHTPEKSGINNSGSNLESYYLSKGIDEIKFPSGLDLFGKMKDSADRFKLDQEMQRDTADADENPEDYYNEEEAENYEDEYYDESQANSYTSPIESQQPKFDMSSMNQTKNDTFLSCEENNFSNFQQNSSSASFLNVLFDQSGVLYGADFNDRNKWAVIGKASVQVIADEMSQKGQFNAYLLCSLYDGHKTFQYDLNTHLMLSRIRNSSYSIYWFDPRKDKSSNLGAIKFENENLLAEFERCLSFCVKKMSAGATAAGASPSLNTSWRPSDILP